MSDNFEINRTSKKKLKGNVFIIEGYFHLIILNEIKNIMKNILLFSSINLIF